MNLFEGRGLCTLRGVAVPCTACLKCWVMAMCGKEASSMINIIFGIFHQKVLCRLAVYSDS
jgi:hypothetical protein